MAKITRKELLKGGLAGAAAVGTLPFASSLAFAREEGGVLAHVHGTVFLTKASGPPLNLPRGFPIEINIDAAGRRDALSGAGWDTGDADSKDQSGACFFAQRGKLQGNELRVHGAVFFSNTKAFVGAPVTTVANLETGETTWTFAGLVFAGTTVAVEID